MLVSLHLKVQMFFLACLLVVISGLSIARHQNHTIRFSSQESGKQKEDGKTEEIGKNPKESEEFQKELAEQQHKTNNLTYFPSGQTIVVPICAAGFIWDPASQCCRETMLWRQLTSEFMGTLFIVLLGCGSTIAGWKEGEVITIFRIAFAFGFSVTAVVEATGHISGGHVNPAVTVAMLMVRRIQLIPGLLYIVSQLVGATLGAAILMSFIPETFNTSLGLNTLDERLSIGQGLGVEILITFLLILVIFAVTDDHRGEIKGTPSTVIGTAVAVGHLFAIPYTGCGMNPARVFGPAAILGEWNNHWVYWIGELVGAILATITYVLFLSADDTPFLKRISKMWCGPFGQSTLELSSSVPRHEEELHHSLEA